MFSKQREERKLTEVTTVIGENTKVEGRLFIESSIRIDGKVYGDIKCDGDVTIGKSGYVEKGIVSRNLFLAGTAKGNVKVENKIHIYESGILDGAAEMKTIIIEENGHFHGKSFMKGHNPTVQKLRVVEMEKDSSSKREKENEIFEQQKQEEPPKNKPVIEQSL